MIKFFIIFASILTFSYSAFSKDYQIEELLNIAEKNSANIKSAQYLAISQKHLANQEKYWDNPTIGVDRVWGENKFTINQKVPFYGKLKNKYDVEEASYHILKVRKNGVVLSIKAEVFNLLYQYQALKKKIELASNRVNRLTLVDRYLSKITINSPTKRARWYITKNKIKLAKRDLVKFENQLRQTWNRANVYLNLVSEPERINLIWFDDENYPGKNFFVDKALENNPELRRQKLLIKKYKSELSFAKVEKMPDLNLSVSRHNGSASGIGSIGANRDSTGVGLSVSIPLFDRNKEKIIAAKSKIKSQRRSLEFYQNQLIQSIGSDINEYETFIKLSKSFPIKDIEKIISRLSKANIDFKKGTLDLETYAELDSQEYQIIYTIIDTQTELAAAYSSLMTKVGSFTMPTGPLIYQAK